MSWIDGLRHRLRALFDREGLGREMEEEIRFHVEQQARYESASFDAATADVRRASQRRFGNVLSVGEERRRASGLASADRVLQDVQFALRQLRRTPGYTVAVSFTLALGIGANAVMFAIVDRTMLRAPEGIANASRVVEIKAWRTLPDGRRDSSWLQTYPSYVEFRAMNDAFQRVTAVRGPTNVAVDRGPSASSARVALVADYFFETLGVRPAIGRFFDVQETNERGGAAVVVLSHGYWRRHFGTDPAILGRVLIVNNSPYTIIGVAQRGFAGHTLAAVDLWIPIAAAEGLRDGGKNWSTARGMHWLTVIAKLREGIAPARAITVLETRWSGWNLTPDRPPQPEWIAKPYFRSMVAGESSGRPEYRVARLLTGVALLLLVITCANVANLQLARALARRREIAIRLALGVSRARLLFLFVSHSVLLGVVAGAVAVALAAVGIPIVRSVLFAGVQTESWAIDARLVAFTMFIALVAGSMAGIVPAIQASRPSLIGALKQGTREGAVHRSRTRSALLVAQAALSVALLAGLGLFVRSLQQIGAQQLGLDLRRVIVADFSDRRGFSPETVREMYEDMRSRTVAIPGVEAASFSVGVPFEGQYGLPLRVAGGDTTLGRTTAPPRLYAVDPTFFRTMGTRLVAGRLFTETDAHGAAVAVVNERMAKQLWSGNALGRCFKIVLRAATPDCVQVIGVVENARRAALLDSAADPQYYVPLGQQPPMMDDLTLLVRAPDPRRVMAPLRRALQSTRSDMPFVRVRTLEEAVAPELRPWRLGVTVFALFGGLALLVAAIGTYNVMQFSVSQRVHELGVRIALGARRSDIVTMVARESLYGAAIGSVAGVLVVLGAGGVIGRFLYHTSPHDPSVLSAVVLTLLLSGIVASVLPAVRATRVDPVTSLKAE
jgi:predicted permease